MNVSARWVMALASAMLSGCTGTVASSVSCGEGTTLVDEQCVATLSQSADAAIVLCGEGTHLAGGFCFADGTSDDGGISCGAGTHLVGASCVADPVEGITCGPGTHQSGTQCFVDASNPTDGGIACGEGTHLVGSLCIADPVTFDGGTLIGCGAGTHLSGSFCVPDAVSFDAGVTITCGPGTHLVGTSCAPDLLADGGTGITCGAGTVLVGLICVPTSVAPKPASWLRVTTEVTAPGWSLMSPSGRYVFSVALHDATADAGGFAITTATVRDLQTNTVRFSKPAQLQCFVTMCWATVKAVAFSPDEQKLSLLTSGLDIGGDVDFDFSVVDLATGVETALDTSVYGYVLLGWSPDSQALLFKPNDPPYRITRVAVPSLASTTLLSTNSYFVGLAYSHDGGTAVAAIETDAGVAQLVTMPGNGGALTMLVDAGIVMADNTLASLAVSATGYVVYAAYASPTVVRVYSRPLHGGAAADLGVCNFSNLHCDVQLSPTGMKALIRQTASTRVVVPTAGGAAQTLSLANLDTCQWLNDDLLACRMLDGALRGYRLSTSASSVLATGVTEYVAGNNRVLWHENGGTASLRVATHAVDLPIGSLKTWDGSTTTEVAVDVVNESKWVPSLGQPPSPLAVTTPSLSTGLVDVAYFDVVHGMAPGPNNGLWRIPLE